VSLIEKINGVIDKGSYIPYYIQIKNIIVKAIEDKIIVKKEKIPSEEMFCKKFNISRTVIRQAVRELTLEGYLYTKKGIGSFISEQKIVDGMIKNIEGFYEDMTRKGYKVGSKLLDKKIKIPDKKVSNLLMLNEKEKVIEIKRLRMVNNENILVVTNYIPYNIFPGIQNEDIIRNSFYKIIKDKYNLEIFSSKRLIGAKIANKDEAELLNIKKGSPLIFLDSISYLKDGKPIEYFYSIHRADKIVFEVELYHYNIQ